MYSTDVQVKIYRHIFSIVHMYNFYNTSVEFIICRYTVYNIHVYNLYCTGKQWIIFIWIGDIVQVYSCKHKSLQLIVYWDKVDRLHIGKFSMWPPKNLLTKKTKKKGITERKKLTLYWTHTFISNGS